jgi:DNA mismatch repair protein MutS2
MFLNLLKNNTEALELLDWFQIVSDISSLSHFEITKKNLLIPPQFYGTPEIQNKLDQLQFILDNYDDFSLVFNSHIRLIPADEDRDDHQAEHGFRAISFLFKERFFDTEELNFFALLFSGFKETRKSFFRIPFTDQYNISQNSLDAIRNDFLFPLRNFVDQSGKISYERHPVLKNLNFKLLQLEHELRNLIVKTAQSETYKSRLQIDNFDIIHDRYVLSIRSDSYQANLGTIISRSQSGMTLFVEPFELRDKSNQRLHLLSEIESTILHLTIDLSKVIHRYAFDLQSMASAVLFFDLIFTKATYSLRKHFVKPLLATDFHFEVQGFFHPLVDRPISNSLELKYSHNGLILSGPNTGGKTVALKSLCLCMLFLHMGLFVPASKATLYPTEGLYYFSHDHQNISKGLSSFSAEAKYYLSLLEELSSNNLIFIDEIFNSTSSEEASALAMALFNEIHTISSSKLIISTHHQMLKTFMHSRQDYISAHVGFDLLLGKPTFKILYGEPGNSLALTIFSSLADQFITQTNIAYVAQEYLDKKSLSYETLLLELSQKKIELDKLISVQKSLEIDLKNQRASMEGVLFLEKEKELVEFNKKLKTIFNEAETLLSSIRDKKITSKNTFFNQVAGISRVVPLAKTDLISKNPYSHLSTIPFVEILPTMTVFSLDFKKNVKVLLVNQRKQEVQIQHGALSSWVDPKTLCYTSAKAVPRVQFLMEKTSRQDIEIDCRGMRLLEFQNACELSINELIAGEIPFLTVVHGHGEGVLKNWLRKHLKENHRDLRWENIEGNDGCTKIFLS